MKKFLFLSIVIFSIYSCGDTEIEERDRSNFGYEYYPLEIGYEWQYLVDSVLIGRGGLENIISTSFVKDEIKSLISDENGEKVYRLERSHKINEDADWNLKNIWKIAVDENRAYRTEENLRFVKLVFPVIKGTKWDGNIFFDSNEEFPVAQENLKIYQNWNYKIEYVDEPRSINDISYDQVLEVSHIDEDGLLERRFSKELYAKGVGLIERDIEIFDTQNGNTSLSWVDRAEKGYKLHQKLISFNKN